MRTILAVAMLLGLGCAGPCFAQSATAPDSGTIGSKEMGASPGSPHAGSPGATMPSGDARRETANQARKAIPPEQARSTLQNNCGGPITALSLDASSVWHAKCHKGGHAIPVTLDPDGMTHEQ